MAIDIAVAGSINHDLTLRTTELPVPGQTVLAHSHRSGPGGKGANQAVAAARLGSSVALIARVGDDEEGASLLGSLRSEGIDTAGVIVDRETPTGLAVITVDDGAENTIVVSPGANMRLTPDDILTHEATVATARVVLTQLEIPVDCVIAAARTASGVFCLNPAPARELPAELLERIDLLIPNRSELATLSGSPLPRTLDEVQAAVSLLETDAAVVVTLGDQGSVVIQGDDVTPIGPPRVSAVDPTGAGDAFCGALANALARDLPLIEAARLATVAGAVAATREGAQESMPERAEIDALGDF